MPFHGDIFKFGCRCSDPITEKSLVVFGIAYFITPSHPQLCLIKTVTYLWTKIVLSFHLNFGRKIMTETVTSVSLTICCIAALHC